MKGLAAALAVAGGGLILCAATTSLDEKLQTRLRQLFPSASGFSAKEGEPPHFTAFINDPRTGRPTAMGFAFWTTDLEPGESGYEGPIKILVGLDMKGILTGIVVAEHHEPYGYFSIDPPQFAAQFRGKSIRDAFKVGADIDAVSRASISVTSASRAVKNSARRVATQLLTPEAAK